ncbi:adenosylcobinamide-phosphate synthase CbiB [Sporosarcina highlanderae]|uniref:Cobalamin biosynthesis protein CobD n=1 Tax=Sporosarcina highlanderae TaxID=3035916 RepID=A0ABT8JLY3_9BACL|nr:adenosylcobinamide-phosphate synthase CbiB [Sporosarcina highlanderae]MDN4606042.1 adenosylcobinamide-phosphate synthase CbiB [Sporosarcina highlanderae]
MQAHFVAIALGFVLDRLIGDPPNWPHPVRWIGTFISKLTAALNKGRARVLKGAGMLFIIIFIVTAIVIAVIGIAYQLHIVFGIIVEAILIAIGLAQKSLKDAALEVYAPLEAGDMDEARKKLSWIVGRDTDKLKEPGIARGAIETVSENTSDGVTAPLFWAFLFGAPGLWMYKAVNTLDSMIGYKDERYRDFGKFSALTDDVLNFIPARITGLLILLVSPNEGGIPLRKRLVGWSKDARCHPSPNSGFLEAATAWQLGVKLGGKSTYRGVVSERPEIGPGQNPLKAAHIKSAIRQMHAASFAFWIIFTIIGVIFYAIA